MGKKKYTLKLVKEPIYDFHDFEINPLCADGKVHIRFRSYKDPEVIAGFEAKLTFLLVYLFKETYTYNNVDYGDRDIVTGKNDYIWDKYSKMFLDSDELKPILSELMTNHINFKGLKLLRNYKKRGYSLTWVQFGSISDDIILFDSKNNLGSPLKMFLNKLNISLLEYLYNDGVYLVISRPSNSPLFNSKFVNKYQRRKPTENKEVEFFTTSLWG